MRSEIKEGYEFCVGLLSRAQLWHLQLVWTCVPREILLLLEWSFTMYISQATQTNRTDKPQPAARNAVRSQLVIRKNSSDNCQFAILRCRLTLARLLVLVIMRALEIVPWHAVGRTPSRYLQTVHRTWFIQATNLLLILGNTKAASRMFNSVLVCLSSWEMTNLCVIGNLISFNKHPAPVTLSVWKGYPGLYQRRRALLPVNLAALFFLG